MKPDSADILAGKRRALAKAITLVESQLSEHREQAQELLTELLPLSGKSVRIGISGTPGVGKSTFIEAFGQHLLQQGKKVAVLAVDPSSPLSGGSILGDKTRMAALSREVSAYIRPSPASGQLGGVAQKTRESIIVCEAAGFDVIVVETVGVGQSEFAVGNMVDFFLVLMQPNAGDELQGIKKGILELADALVINKADGEGKALAEQAAGHYQNAMNLLTHGDDWTPEIRICSARDKTGIEDVWKMIERFQAQVLASKRFENKRAEQNVHWMRAIMQELLEQKMQTDAAYQARKTQLEKQVAGGKVTPLTAAKSLVNGPSKSG